MIAARSIMTHVKRRWVPKSSKGYLISLGEIGQKAKRSTNDESARQVTSSITTTTITAELITPPTQIHTDMHRYTHTKYTKLKTVLHSPSSAAFSCSFSLRRCSTTFLNTTAAASTAFCSSCSPSVLVCGASWRGEGREEKRNQLMPLDCSSSSHAHDAYRGGSFTGFIVVGVYDGCGVFVSITFR